MGEEAAKICSADEEGVISYEERDNYKEGDLEALWQDFLKRLPGLVRNMVSMGVPKQTKENTVKLYFDKNGRAYAFYNADVRGVARIEELKDEMRKFLGHDIELELEFVSSDKMPILSKTEESTSQSQELFKVAELNGIDIIEE